MVRTIFFVAVFALACNQAGAVAAAQDEGIENAPLIDLTGDLARDVSGDPHGAGLYSCGIKDTIAENGLLGYLRVGALILSRDRAKARPSSMVYGTQDGATLLDSADLGLGTSTGLDITLLSPLTNALEIEVRYFAINGWRASRTASAPDGIRFQGFGAESTGDAERFDYSSRLYNIEVGMRPRVRSGIPFLFGFRTLQLHERFEAWSQTGDTMSRDIGVRSNNFLYGAQIGVEPYLMGAGGPLRLEGMLKAGIYGNLASQETSSQFLNDSLGVHKTRTAFVGELGVAGIYQVSGMIAIRAGYELLWVKGVALAPDQASGTNILSGAASLNCASTSLYQGVMASVDFVF